MPSNLVPAARFSRESREKNSRFISTIGPASTVDQAKSFISAIRQKYPDATHNVPAFIIGFGPAVIEHANDDGEPSGTAGRPALSVLKGSGLGDAVLVITRYFGGTKLGTGGLVRAYKNAARLVVDSVPKAEKITVHVIELNIPYNLYNQVIQLIFEYQGGDLKEDFQEQVTISCALPADQVDTFNSSLLELSRGALTANIIRENQSFLRRVRSEH